MRSVRPVISVVSLNYDRTPRKRWTAELVDHDPPLIELAGVFDRDITHPELGQIVQGTLTKEYFWLDRWYNVFRFEEPSGDLKYFYCNIATPPKFHDDALEYVDLDIDLLVWPDSSYQVLDEDDFEASARRHSYPTDLVDRVKATLDAMLSSVEKKEFPFG